MNADLPPEHEVLVLFTMDAEPAASKAPGGAVSGPADNAEGALRITEYMEVLSAYGYTPTFFIHPELGREQSALFLKLQSQGAGLGLHIHAVKSGQAVELGGLPAAVQRETLQRGLQLFSEYFGFRPEIFRPGCFSANDCTYQILHELGFKGGSVCIPGRVWTERCCVWSGACPHPHYANPYFRQLEGGLPFVEIPLSVDRSRLLRHPLGFDYYADLRPGDVYTSENVVPRDHRQVLTHIIRQLAVEKPRLKTIVIDVHNDRNFKDMSTAPAQQLRCILDHLAPELANYGMKPVNATFEQAIGRFRQSAAEP